MKKSIKNVLKGLVGVTIGLGIIISSMLVKATVYPNNYLAGSMEWNGTECKVTTTPYYLGLPYYATAIVFGYGSDGSAIGSSTTMATEQNEYGQAKTASFKKSNIKKGRGIHYCTSDCNGNGTVYGYFMSDKVSKGTNY